MKRSWIGFFLLLALLGIGLLATWVMADIHEPMEEKLEEAAEAALDENWPKAAWLTASVRQDWEKWLLLRAGLVDHGPMEDIDAMFAALEVYGASREKIAFAALCRELSKKIEAIGDAHGLQWENIL